MVTQKISFICDYTQLINCAGGVLRLTHDEIKKRYSDFPIFLTECIEKGVHENYIEIRFDDKCTTLLCSFDKNSICTTCHLFLDNTAQVFSYVTYLQSHYTYDYIRSCWLLPHHSYLSVKRTKDDIFLVSHY